MEKLLNRIGHQTVCQQPTGRPIHGGNYDSFEYRTVFQLMKEFVPSVCPVQDIVNDFARGNTCSSGHRATLHRSTPSSQEKVCVPFIYPLQAVRRTRLTNSFCTLWSGDTLEYRLTRGLLLYARLR